VISKKNNAIIQSTHDHFVRWILLAILAISLPMALALAAPGQAAGNSTFVVDSLADDPDNVPGDGLCETDLGECTLRAAITEAQSSAFLGPDTIDLSGLTGVIALGGSVLPIITEDLVIQGPAVAADLEINAASDDRHFIVDFGAAVEIASLHLSSGYGGIEGSGGSIYNGGSLTLTGVTISDSSAGGDGGAVYNGGSLTLTGVTISGSSAGGDGGAVYGAAGSSTIIENQSQIGLLNQGNSADYGGAVSLGNGEIGNGALLVIDDSVVSHNSASIDGGGVYNWTAEVTIQNGSVIEENHAVGRGGGIYNNNSGIFKIVDSTIATNLTDGDGGGAYNYYSALTLVNTTVSGNQANGSGGGIVEESTDTLHLYNATITDNVADADADGSGAGGGLVANGTIYITNSILAGNRDLSTGAEIDVHPDCSVWFSPTFVANSFNVVGDNTGCEDIFVDGVSGNQVGSANNPLDPGLGSLSTDQSGALTHPVLAGSPALDAGNPDGCREDDGVLILTDQRGIDRPQGARCDAGAYEAAWPSISDQFFAVEESSPNGTLVGFVEADDPNLGYSVLFAITGGNGVGDGAFAINTENGALTVADSSQLDPLVNPSFALSVTVSNAIGLTDTAIVTVDVLIDPLIVRNTNDSGASSLREALSAANELPGINTITFAIPGPGPHVILPATPLPVIFTGMVIDAETQPSGAVILDGSTVEGDSNGLEIVTFDVTVRGLEIQNFSGHGIYWWWPTRTRQPASSHNVIEDNVITGNAGNGVLIEDMAFVTVRSNSIYDNGLLGIDLNGDGVTPNDIGDGDVGANDGQNYPVLLRAIPDDAQTLIEGRLNSTSLLSFDVEFYVSDTCDPSDHGEGKTLIGATFVTTDANGNDRFSVTLPVALSEGQFITALATDGSGNTSEFSQCIVTGPGNDSWPRAYRMTLTRSADAQMATASHYVDLLGQSRWYKFQVEPDSQVTVELGNLPANYDIVVYKDIAAVFASLTEPQTETDLSLLGAEFAPDMFAPDMFAPDMFAPDMFAPDMFAPDMFAPDMFAPDMFAPDMFAPDMFAPDMFAPDMFAPDMFAPDMFAPDMFAPDNFDPNVFVENPQAYSSAQLRSIIAFSALSGVADERAVVNTWTSTGDFYVRVRGRNGVASLQAPFQLNVTIQRGLCENLDTTLVPTSLTGVANGYKTVILVDQARLATQFDPDEVAAMLAELQTLAGRSEVGGVIVFVDQDARVATANAQADDKVNCPQAKNLVADAIKQVVQRYRNVNPLEYLVIVGGDNIIPFFRTPDRALLAVESNYIPPVFNFTASQASLKLDYVLSQDAYGSTYDVSYKSHYIPVPDLAVGRLVETPADIMNMLAAYIATPNGVVETPDSAFVSGYDFLAEVAEAVQGELEAGIGQPASTLIAPRDQAPQDPNAWTGAQLIAGFLGQRHDLNFLAGHFSASSALAADFQTRMTTQDLVTSPVNLTNSIIFSPGCHSGYNIVNQHGVPLVTVEPDWAQAFAMKGATFIGGTGYQYGHTDFIAYSEQIYLNFSKQLRYGAGPVSIGKALVAAKQTYLADTPILRGIDEKSLLQTTLFGLPMLAIDLPTGRVDPPNDPPGGGGTTPYGADPGLTLGLRYADLSVSPTLTPVTRVLSNTNDLSQTIIATYLEGGDALLLNPTEPVLPVLKRNVSVPGTMLRGVGFRSGVYNDLFDIIPLTSAAATEVRGIQFPFPSQAFYPTRVWNANYFDVLANGPVDGITRLMVIPAQFRGNGMTEIDGTLRSYSDMAFRLFYSDNTTTFPRAGANAPEANTPALAAPPAIVQVTSITATNSITFAVSVTSDPSVGVQEVWITYTGAEGPFYGQWQSLDLTQDPLDSTLWRGVLALPGGQDWQDVRFIAQAVNGVGLVTMVTNFGDYFIPGIDPGQTASGALPTSLALLAPPASGPYGTPVTFSAQLTDPVMRSGQGAGIAGQVLQFGLGSQRRQALTDDQGIATVQFPLVGLVQEDQLRVSFAGSSRYQTSAAQAPFTIVKQTTSIEVEPAPAVGQYSDDSNLLATLIAGDNRPMQQRTVFFVVGTPAETLSTTSSIITNYAGQAPAGPVNLPVGVYPVTAYFLGVIPVGGGQTVTLEDSRFLASTGIGSLEQSAENATATYTGVTTFLSGKATDVTALVVQEADGMPGDLALAQVRFVVRDGANQVVADVTGSADASGNATASVPALNAGSYTLTIQVVGGFFASPESGPVDIQVMPPTAVTLRELDAQGGEPAGAWLMGLLAAAALVLAALVARRTRTFHGA
jgi:CSLREA domain-containing protein